MSVFEVKVRKIDAVEHHPGADRLDLVVIGGYRAVVKRDEFKAGDLALYIPDDTLFTDLSIPEAMGIAPYLTGKGKNRVKPVRLRGSLSQGIVVPLVKLQPVFQGNVPFKVIDIDGELNFVFNGGKYQDFYKAESQFIIDVLKVEKYEEPIPLQMQGKVRRWPSFLSKYDVENIKRPESFKAMVPGEEIVATEKLHGTNITIAIGPGLEEGEEAFVCSRNNALKEEEGNVYWRAVRKFDLIKKLKRILVDSHLNLDSISLHGEVIGVQDLKYGCVAGEIEFRAFDMTWNGEFLKYDHFSGICTNYGIPQVPIVYRGPFEYDVLAKLAEGTTEIGNCHIREGIVVKPVVERIDSEAGRCNFKFISEAYLLRKGGTELH